MPSRTCLAALLLPLGIALVATFAEEYGYQDFDDFPLPRMPYRQ